MGCSSSNNAAPPAGTVPAPRRVDGTNTTQVPVQRPNVVSRPLVKSSNYKHGSELTQRELNAIRNDFWTTRTEGNSVMWQNIRSAADALVASDLMLASAILEAANIVTPSGSMEMLYDERGQVYKLPMYCFANPIELMGENANNKANEVSEEHSNNKNNGDDDDTAALAGGDPISVRVRVNPGDVNMTIPAQTTFTVKMLKNHIVQNSEKSSSPITGITAARQRMMFMGRELKDKQVISDFGYNPQQVVQVFLRPAAK